MYIDEFACDIRVSAAVVLNLLLFFDIRWRSLHVRYRKKGILRYEIYIGIINSRILF